MDLMGSPITFPTSCLFCALNRAQLLLSAALPSVLEEDLFSCSLVLYHWLQGKHQPDSSLLFCYVFPSLGFSLKTDQQECLSIASSAISLLHKSFPLPLWASQLIHPFWLCFYLPQMLPTILLLFPLLLVHLFELDPEQEELLFSYKYFGPVLTRMPRH